jgi:hypothetical protein
MVDLVLSPMYILTPLPMSHERSDSLRPGVITTTWRTWSRTIRRQHIRELEAAQALQRDQIDAGVLHVPTTKPLDVATIVPAARQSGRPVVVAELMCEGVFPAFRQIALPDEFLEAGALPTLHDLYGRSAVAVVASVKSWL